MTFLQPFILWGLPLVAVPVLIHLLNRMRHRPQRWAAMQFLLAATRSSTNQAKVKQLLVLAFRVLAVAALVLFLSRPLAGGWLGWAFAAAPDVVMILLDRSASMESRVVEGGESRRVSLLKSLSEAARSFEGSSHLLLIESAGRNPQPLARAADLLTISSTSATDTAADVPSMLQSALNWLVENKAGTAEIWMASDLQKSNWKPEDDRWKGLVAAYGALPQKVRVRVLASAESDTPDAWVTVRECFRRRRGEAAELVLTFDIGRTGGTKAKLSGSLVLDGSSVQVEIPMDTQASRFRTLAALGGRKEGGWGKLVLPSDGNAADNTAYFVYGPERTNRVVLHTTDRRVGQYVRLGFEALAAAERIAVHVHPPGSGDLPLEDVTVVCWQGPLPEGSEAARLQSWVSEGGTIFFLPPGSSESRNFLGLGWGAVQTAARDEGWGLGRWVEEDGLLAKSDEGQSLPLRQTLFRRRQTVLGDRQAVASFPDGEVILAKRVSGKGQVFFCSTLPLPEWSSLGDGVVWVPLCQRLLHLGSQRFELQSMAFSGELGLSEAGLAWKAVDASGEGGVQVAAGVYKLGDRLLALNRPDVESLADRLPLDDMLRLFSPLSVSGFSEGAGAERAALQGELWRPLVILMLAALLVEAWLVLPGAKVVGPAAEGRSASTREVRG